MRYWIYSEPLSAESYEPIWQIWSDKAILVSYWDYWCGRMREADRVSQISENNCITDWAAVHWALPATRENLAHITGIKIDG